MHRRALTAIFILIIVFSAGCISGEEKYVSENPTTDYILLRDDGTYFCYQKNAECFEGNYERTDGELLLFVPLGSLRFKDEGNRIIDNGGDAWVKQ